MVRASAYGGEYVTICRCPCYVGLLRCCWPHRDAHADGAGPLLKLLKSGKVPPERQPTVVEMVCKKGNAEDLAYVFGQVLDPAAFAADLRLKTLVWLTDAAKINKVKPDGRSGQDQATAGRPRGSQEPGLRPGCDAAGRRSGR